MATADDAELVEEFERLFRDYYDDDIKELARGYPNERKSLSLDWSDLYRFDPDLAEDYRSQPEQLQEYAEEALRLYDLPIDVKLGQAHVRIHGLPETTDIREIRSRHVNTLVSVSGIVRKATDVQPKIQQAAFECQRCGTLTHIPQTGGDFQEPHECQGCERQGPFQINFDQSEFVDAQKLRVQESPEGLRGGETPQALDVHIEDDITGEVTPGDHVSVTGVLRLEQQGSQQEKSALFDVYMKGMSVVIDDEQFEDMEITDADKQEIVELSTQSDIYDRMVGSIAPSIYGYDQEKLAMTLQLFSGVTKHLPDESRIRGDLHMLLIGDPGTGKCASGDTRVALSDGSEQPIRELVESNLDDPKPVDDGVWDHADIELPSLTDDGSLERRTATKVWKREAPPKLYRIRTASGTEIEVTPSHPLFVAEADSYRAVRADELTVGVHVAVASTAVEDVSTPTGVAADGGGVVADRIETIGTVDPDDDWVYDLEVEGTHTYVSNGIVSHNSQLLSYIQNIAPRSVYTSGKGSSSAGLCVTGDTMVRTDDGFREIRDVVEADIPEPVTDETAVEKELRVATFDRTTGETTDAVTSHAWRMPEKPCRRIETGHGKELEASVNTPVLTCGTDGIEWTPVSEIEPGAYVAVPRYDRVERSAPSVREFLELTTEKIDLADESVSLLRNALVDEFDTLRDAAGELDLSEDFVYDTLANRHVPQEKLDRVLDAVGVCRADLRYDRLMIRHGDSVTVPDRFDEDLLYLLGLVFGDGDISLDRRDGNRGMVRISNGDEELLERAATIFEEKFGKRPEIERQEDRVPCIRVNSATIARLFSNAGMETPKQDLTLDPRLTTARNADAFLRGLMDADGSVSVRDAGGSSVLLSTISETLSRQVQLMLETYGVRARTRERDRRGTYELADGRTIESKHVQHFVEIYGTDIDRYADAIGFETEEKRAALERVVGRTARREEKIPVSAALATVEGTAGQYHRHLRRGDNPGRESARSMLDDIDLGETEPLVREAVEADLRWDEVVAVEDTGEKEVFDLTVPETHNFVGNGVVTHNTAAAVRDDFGEGQQWTLEAGALVLADQGVAAVDELDKMRCVTGDTLVHLGDGRIDRIREVAAEAADDGTVEPLPNGRTVRDVDLDVWTMTDDGTVVTRPVTAVHEYEAPESLTEIELASGERLTATDDHPFFVLADGERVERPAAELCDGDWVYVPRRIPDRATDGGAAATTADAAPQTDDATAMAAVLGYLAGDGNLYDDREEGVYGIRFTNKEEQLLSHFETVCRRAFDGEPTRPPSEQRDDGVETVRLHGREYADAVVEAGMNLETYDGKRLPRAVTTASSEAKTAFLRALADSEGSVESRAVKIHSSSHELLLGAKQLLLEFGVSCQIQHDERADGRDLYILAITDADSLRRFSRQVGFTLDRKRRALDDACETVDGDRTILDVIPDCGDLLEQLRTSLRLHQTECGIGDATYCNFENGDANVSLHRAERILDAFETRRERARSDRDRLRSEETPSWDRLDELKSRYHVSQSELATGTRYSQQAVSRLWGDEEVLGARVRDRLLDIVSDVAETDLTPLRQLVDGDVKWRRVSAVRDADPSDPTDEEALLRRELADVVGCPRAEAVERARDLLDGRPDVDDWEALQATLDRYGVSHTDLADDVGVHQTTVSRWVAGTVETDRFDEVRDAALDRIETVRERVRDLLEAVEARAEPKVYDLTVAGTHNFLANGMVVHNSEDRSAMHEALEQQSYHPDTEVLLADGRRVEIGDLVDERMAERPDAVQDGVDCELLPVDDLRVHTVDTDAGETTKTDVDRVSRHEAPEEFVRVTFSNGRSVTVTPEHPMFADVDGETGTVAAENLSEGAFVPAPRKLPNDDTPVGLTPVEQVGKERDVTLPDELGPDLAEILGLLVAEGHSYAGSSHEIGFSNQDERLLARFERLMQEVFEFGSSETVNDAGTVTKRWISTKLYRWFEENVPEVMHTAREKRVPAAVLGASEEEIRRFLVGAFAGDGGVESEAMSYSTASPGLAEDYADALSKIGVASRIHHDSAEDSWKVYVMGDSNELFVERVVDPADDRYEQAEAFVERGAETRRHHDVLPTSAAVELRDLRRLVGLGCTGRFKPNVDEGYGVQVETVEREISTLRDRIETVDAALDEAEDLADVRAAIDWSARALAERLDDETSSSVHYAENGGYDAERRASMAAAAREAVADALDEAHERVRTLEGRADLRFYRVTDVETIENDGEDTCEWVYDVTVEPTNTFVSKGVVLHNSVSISKAGINATLKSRCSLLGAANPKYGRFDQYEPIGEQIDLEPALISRFDLIFTVTDEPDEEEDRNLAEHILTTNYAGELNTQHNQMTSPDVSREEVDEAVEQVDPDIDAELLRKYVAYAKQNCHPRMTDEARAAIREFYVDLRSKGLEEDAPVPVTARQLEALVRLAEASARVRLSDTVNENDAERVIEIVRSCLQDIGVDPETGQFDADVVETGTSKSQRDRIRNLKELIGEVEEDYEEGAPVEVVMERADEIGMDASKAEHEIEKLKQKGEVYEPATDHLRTT